MYIFSLIISIVMTWTVETNSSVSGEGMWPYDMDLSYRNTYQRGQVRAGDTATLAFTHLEGIDVEAIEVYTRSNKSAGAGVFTVLADGQTIASLSGTFKEWTGAFDNENYHPVSLLSQTCYGVDELTVKLVGTANSLYIEKYVITYSMNQTAPRSVTLMNGTEVYEVLTEAQRGAGVILPRLPNIGNWQFIGWSETELNEIYEYPPLYVAGERFYPEQDGTLWATYEYYVAPELETVTHLGSGVYLYVNSESGSALTGVPVNGRMTTATASVTNEDLLYEMSFTDENTVYITHFKTNTPIGYSGTSMAAVQSPWQVYHDGEQSLIYTTIGEKNYILWLNIHDIRDGSYYAGLLEASAGPSPMRLMAVPPITCVPLITCHPEGLQALSNPHTDTKEYILPFGNYELHIVNGHKYLKIRP